MNTKLMRPVCVYSQDQGQTVYETVHKLDNEGFCKSCGMRLVEDFEDLAVDVTEDGDWIIL